MKSADATNQLNFESQVLLISIFCFIMQNVNLQLKKMKNLQWNSVIHFIQ